MPTYKTLPLISGNIVKLIKQFEAGPSHIHRPPSHVQGTVNQCNADSLTTAMEFQNLVQGNKYVQLSPADLFCRIRQPDGNSYIGDAIAEARVNGVGFASVSGTVYKPSMTVSSDTDRAKNRIKDIFWCPTFEHVLHATIYGFGLISPLTWYTGYKPDSLGWLPPKGGGSAFGHAMFGFKPTFRIENGKIDFAVWYMQSYGNSNPNFENCYALNKSIITQGFAIAQV